MSPLMIFKASRNGYRERSGKIGLKRYGKTLPQKDKRGKENVVSWGPSRSKWRKEVKVSCQMQNCREVSAAGTIK